jgi:hypothetical protein
MTNEKEQVISQIFSRLCFHAGTAPELHEGKRIIFTEKLLPYPEDLICAAYHHSRKCEPRFPTVEHFISFMQPEYERRREMENV